MSCCYITYVMLYDICSEQNRKWYITCVMLCYITYVMLCYITYVMLCCITYACYVISHMFRTEHVI